MMERKRNITAVSYTHLDVYKRQDIGGTATTIEYEKAIIAHL